MSGSCAGTPEYAQLQQETVSKVSGIQEICGKGTETIFILEQYNICINSS